MIVAKTGNVLYDLNRQRKYVEYPNKGFAGRTRRWEGGRREEKDGRGDRTWIWIRRWNTVTINNHGLHLAVTLVHGLNQNKKATTSKISPASGQRISVNYVYSSVLKYIKVVPNVLRCFTASAYYIMTKVIKMALISHLKFGRVQSKRQLHGRVVSIYFQYIKIHKNDCPKNNLGVS